MCDFDNLDLKNQKSLQKCPLHSPRTAKKGEEISGEIAAKMIPLDRTAKKVRLMAVKSPRK